MILAILAGVTIVAAAGWGAGALWFQSPRGGAWRALSVACWLALAGAALLGLALEHAAPLWLFGAALLGLLAWWRLGCGRPMRAAGCPKWRGRRAATSTATGSRCTTCAISTGARAATTTCAGAPRPTICRVWNRWMSRCRTGAPRDRPCAGVLWLRRRPARGVLGRGTPQAGRCVLRDRGFFRQYELSVLASTEEDSLRVRTNVRGEDGYLYRVHMPEGGARALFLAYVETANGLARQPRFYNTLTANCITIVYQLARRIVPGLPMDYRLLLSGYLPEYLYRIGALRGRTARGLSRRRPLYRPRARHGRRGAVLAQYPPGRARRMRRAFLPRAPTAPMGAVFILGRPGYENLWSARFLQARRCRRKLGLLKSIRSQLGLGPAP